MNEFLEDNGFTEYKNFLNIKDFEYLKTSILDVINKTDIEKINVNLNNNFNKLRFSNKTIFNRRCKSRDGDEGLLDIWHINKSLDDKSNAIINEINNNIKQILEDSFKIKYKFINNNVYLNKSVTSTRGIHADSGDYPSRTKYFLYLTDINDVHDGPFSFIKGSHKKIGKNYHRKYDIYEPLNQEDKKNYIIFSPKQNDMLIACVSGAHRGMPQKPGRERLVLVGTFDPVL
jgi:hypothetical protein